LKYPRRIAEEEEIEFKKESFETMEKSAYRRALGLQTTFS
jgi:hypothetical protein